MIHFSIKIGTGSLAYTPDSFAKSCMMYYSSFILDNVKITGVKNILDIGYKIRFTLIPKLR